MGLLLSRFEDSKDRARCNPLRAAGTAIPAASGGKRSRYRLASVRHYSQAGQGNLPIRARERVRVDPQKNGAPSRRRNRFQRRWGGRLLLFLTKARNRKS